MQWKADKATAILEKLFTLEKSYTKLRWYVNEYKVLQDHDGELITIEEEKLNSIEKQAIEFKESLISYEEIVKRSSPEFKQPIRNISGVYFLINSALPDGEKIVYVGLAKSIMNRLSGHFWKVEKEFDRVHYIELKVEEEIQILEQVESYYIWHLGYPKYNKDAGKNDHIVRKLLSLGGFKTK